ncbi:MAG: hypothetical protein R3F59_21275 [Myxococcota bacterium]
MTQWCFSAVSSVEPTLTCLAMIEIFGAAGMRPQLKAGVEQIAHRWLGHVGRRLAGREWIACDAFTVADILMADVLRGAADGPAGAAPRGGGLRGAVPRAAGAWERTLRAYAERFRVDVETLR